MSWKCFIVTDEDNKWDVPGAMWWGVDGDGKRIWMVALPGGAVFTSEHIATDGGRWAVSGEPPNITVSPSINVEGIYHGFIRDGVITDDVEGRTFP